MTELPFGGVLADDLKSFAAAKSGGGSPWIITFADLMALILSFFILMFSMSSIQTKAWMAVVVGLSDKLSPGREQAITGAEQAARPLRVLDPKGIDLGYLVSVMRNKFQTHAVLKYALVEEGLDRVTVALPLDLLFERDSATPTANAAPTLFAVGEALGSVKNRIEIHAYAAGQAGKPGADDIIADDPYSSGWELAIARSLIAAGFLRDSGLARAPMPVGHNIAPTRKAVAKIELVVREMGVE